MRSLQAIRASLLNVKLRPKDTRLLPDEKLPFLYIWRQFQTESADGILAIRYLILTQYSLKVFLLKQFTYIGSKAKHYNVTESEQVLKGSFPQNGIPSLKENIR